VVHKKMMPVRERECSACGFQRNLKKIYSHQVANFYYNCQSILFLSQDIRPTKPGDALLAAHILDYDLVRQLRDELNKVKVFRGVYDPRFIESSQHQTATHVLSNDEASNDSEALKCLRADIRYFKWRNGVVGHTTVIWSANVEPNCEILANLHTARDLLAAIETPEERRGGPLPPSILYATAALLEGCTFINGGSQNTLVCPALADLARQQVGVYCLGTDFKAGQTNFETAVVEYLGAIGLTPNVLHDEKRRDFAEYSSLGFVDQPLTIVAYTRASYSLMCVPLMIDAAVWCDYFSGRSWPYDKVSKALSYLFKVPVCRDVIPCWVEARLLLLFPWDYMRWNQLPPFLKFVACSP